MAKNDNLTDFLTGLADKLRSLLSTADPINPQEFEDKIQGVYDKGFAEGGPTGITATAADVLSGKVFGSGGSAKATGTMPNRSGVSRPTKYQATDGAHLYSWIPYGFCANYDGNGHLIEQPFSSVASAIGLTAAKLVAGNTVLGIAGTGKGNLGAYYGSSYSGGSNGSTAVDVVSVSSTSRITANSWQKCTIKTAGSYRICAQGEASHWDGDGAWAIRKNGADLKSGVNKMGVINFTVTCTAGDALELYKMPRFNGSWCVIAL